MPNHEPLSRSGITSRTGVPNDVLTHWIRYGLVRPIYAPSGGGRHLRFEWYEANIAAIMHQLRTLGFHMDGMLSIAAVYREAILWATRHELSRDDVFALWSMFQIRDTVIKNQVMRKQYLRMSTQKGIDRATRKRLAEAGKPYPMIDEIQEMVQAAAGEIHGAQRVTQRIIDISRDMPPEEFRQHLDPFLTITEQPEPGEPGLDSADPESLTYFWRVGEGNEVHSGFGAAGSARAHEDGAVAMIAIDVTSILFKVWNPDAVADTGDDAEADE